MVPGMQASDRQAAQDCITRRKANQRTSDGQDDSAEGRPSDGRRLRLSVIVVVVFVPMMMPVAVTFVIIFVYATDNDRWAIVARGVVPRRIVTRRVVTWAVVSRRRSNIDRLR
jgi:hypothetical protein